MKDLGHMDFESVSGHHQIRDCPVGMVTANITEKVKETISS